LAADVAEFVGYNEDSATPLTVSKPVGFNSADQRLVYVLAQDGGLLSALTVPSTWTAITAGTVDISSQRVKGFYHDYTGSEPSTWDFPYDSGSSVAGALFRCTGVDTSVAPVCANANTTSNLATMDSPTVTPTGSTDLLLTTYSNQGGAHTLSYTAPTGMTNLGSSQVAGGFQCIAAAKQQLASSSATGAKTWTGLSPTGGAAGTFSIAIKSAVSGAVTVTDAPMGVLLGTPAEAVVFSVVVPDTASGVLVGVPQESALLAVVVADTPIGLLLGTPGEASLVGVTAIDSPLGVLLGTPAEAVVYGTVVGDAPVGILLGGGTESVTAAGPGAVDVTVTDSPLGLLLGLASESALLDVLIPDGSLGLIVGAPAETTIR
jgi:hypothetical protein